MKVIKKLNNNYAICLDNGGNEVIAFGKGIGFPKVPYEIEDLSKIDRTFYDIEAKYLDLITEIPEDILQFTTKLIDIARNELQYELNPNLIVTLSDHINFCIQRAKKGIYIQLPLTYEMEQSFPKEMKLGKYAVHQIERRFSVKLNANEASGIAMSFVNAHISNDKESQKLYKLQDQFETILEDTITIVEYTMKIVIERDSFNFARYSSHLMYLLKRISSGKSLDTDNEAMYQSICDKFPKVAECVNSFEEYFNKKYDIKLTKEEKMYLMLHINRICTREGL